MKISADESPWRDIAEKLANHWLDQPYENNYLAIITLHFEQAIELAVEATRLEDARAVDKAAAKRGTKALGMSQAIHFELGHGAKRVAKRMSALLEQAGRNTHEALSE